MVDYVIIKIRDWFLGCLATDSNQTLVFIPVRIIKWLLPSSLGKFSLSFTAKQTGCAIFLWLFKWCQNVINSVFLNCLIQETQAFKIKISVSQVEKKSVLTHYRQSRTHWLTCAYPCLHKLLWCWVSFITIINGKLCVIVEHTAFIL